MPKIIIFPLMMVSAIILFFSGFVTGKKGLNVAQITSPNKISENILYLTSPVTSFNGKVDKVEGNAIWVSQQVMQITNTVSIPIEANSTAQPLPTPVVKTLTYKVLLTKDTQISRPAVNIFYLFKRTSPESAIPTGTQKKLSVTDVKKDQMVAVNSKQDLRTLPSNEVEANSIQLPAIPNTVYGTITAIKDNTISLKGTVQNMAAPPMTGDNQQPTQVEYVVSVDQNTEISRFGMAALPKEGTVSKPPEPEELSLSDLKVNGLVTVYTDVDVTQTKQFKALRIEPAHAPVLAPAITPPSNAAVPSPESGLNTTVPATTGSGGLNTLPTTAAQ